MNGVGLHDHVPSLLPGLFDESIYYESDWDLWKRFAQARALFLFVKRKSGLYHIRGDSQARTRRAPGATP